MRWQTQCLLASMVFLSSTVTLARSNAPESCQFEACESCDPGYYNDLNGRSPCFSKAFVFSIFNHHSVLKPQTTTPAASLIDTSSIECPPGTASSAFGSIRCLVCTFHVFQPFILTVVGRHVHQTGSLQIRAQIGVHDAKAGY